jgi:mediator of RNA polymerase II transcription subunit 17
LTLFFISLLQGTDSKEEAAQQPPSWQWESVRSKLRNALAEASVLLDVIHVSREKKYLVLDPVGQDPQPRRPIVQMLAKKKGLGTAAEILVRGADKLKLCQSEASRNRGVPNFHLELLKLRQNWRLKKVGKFFQNYPVAKLDQNLN